MFSEHPAPTNLWCRKPNEAKLFSLYPESSHGETTWIKAAAGSASSVFTDQSNILYLVEMKRGFNTAEKCSLEMPGFYQITGFGSSHSLALKWLTASTHQQEIDSKNKDQAATISASSHTIHLTPVETAVEASSTGNQSGYSINPEFQKWTALYAEQRGRK